MIISYRHYSLLRNTLTKGVIMKKFILFSILSVLLYSAPGYTMHRRGKEGAWQAVAGERRAQLTVQARAQLRQAVKEREAEREVERIAKAEEAAAARLKALEAAEARKVEREEKAAEEEKLAQLTAQVEQTQQHMDSLTDQILSAYHEEEDGNEGAYAKVQLLEAHAAYAEQVDAQAPAAHKRWSDAYVEWKGIKEEWQEWQETVEDTEEEVKTARKAPKAQKEAAWAKMAAWVAEGEVAKKAWVAEGEAAQYTQTAEEAHRKAPWQRLDEMTYLGDMENSE